MPTIGDRDRCSFRSGSSTFIRKAMVALGMNPTDQAGNSPRSWARPGESLPEHQFREPILHSNEGRLHENETGCAGAMRNRANRPGTRWRPREEWLSQRPQAWRLSLPPRTVPACLSRQQRCTRITSASQSTRHTAGTGPAHLLRRIKGRDVHHHQEWTKELRRLLNAGRGQHRLHMEILMATKKPSN
jgi:hypothetical protein